MRYQPKRSTKRWLEGAPPALLAVYDNGGKSADRYTALYGAPIWTPSYGRKVPARFMSVYPSHPQGIGLSGEVSAFDRAALGRKVRFADLPTDVKRCIVADCTDDETGKPLEPYTPPRHGRAVRPSDLGKLDSTQQSHYLYCRRCNGTYSADYADYRFHTGDAPFKCCGVNNYLLARRSCP